MTHCYYDVKDILNSVLFSIKHISEEEQHEPNKYRMILKDQKQSLIFQLSQYIANLDRYISESFMKMTKL